jgi:hypothetical protein
VLVAPLMLIGLSAPWGFLSVVPPVRSLIGALIAATLLAYIPVLAEPRFHLPLMPFLAVFAAAVWSAPHPIGDIRDQFRKRRPWPWLALVACAALVAIWLIDFSGGLPRLLAILAPGGNRLWLNY